MGFAWILVLAGQMLEGFDSTAIFIQQASSYKYGDTDMVLILSVFKCSTFNVHHPVLGRQGP